MTQIFGSRADLVPRLLERLHHEIANFFQIGTAEVKGQALDLCQELFVADGAFADEEDAVFQDLRQLLE